MRINHNIAALNTYRQLTVNTSAGSKSLEKLSSGYRINRAGDDAAGLAISEKMRGQIRGLDQASRNSQDAISLIQTAEGALNETHSILQRMRELAVQSATDTNTSIDRAEIQKEIDQLATEITRIANDTEFNTQKLLNGGITSGNMGESTFHIGANAGQNINISISAMDAKTLGVARDVSTATATGAGIVTGATVNEAYGPAVTDGEVVTLTYAAGTAAKAATNATKTAEADLGVSIAFNTATKIVINGTDVTLNAVSALGATFDGAGRIAEVVTALQTDIDSAIGSSVYTVGYSGSKLTITDVSKTGTTSEVDMAGSDAGVGATLLGFTALDAVNGTDAVAEVSATVTLTGAAGAAQVVNVEDTDTTIDVEAGSFKGVSITLSGAASTIAGGDDTVTFALSTTAATAATFSGGAKTADAITAAGIDVSTKTVANSAITSIEAAITAVSAERSKLGAVQNRLEHTINNLETSSENLTASESRIRDVDMAKEMMEFTKNNILQQAATAMLAQANQQPQGVLQLLQ
jgi:flagellin